MNEKILLIDTATEACSVALFVQDQLFSEYQVAPRKQAELLLPMIDNIMQQAQLKLTDLSALAFVRGPGAFTGVRVAAGVIQGLALATGLPVLAISSLQLMAQGAYEVLAAQNVVAAIDARMGEVYWGNFSLDKDGIMQSVDQEQVRAPEDVEHYFPTQEVVSVGTGWSTYGDNLAKQYQNLERKEAQVLYPNARYGQALLRHQFNTGQILSPEQCVPVYLRNQVAKKTVLSKK